MLEYIKNMKTENKALAVVVLLAIVGMIYGWYRSDFSLSKTTPTQLPVAAAAALVPKVDVPVQKIRAFNKGELAKKVILPEEVKSDATKEVSAVVEVPPTKGGAEVVSVIDKVTGENTLYARAKPVPFFEFENKFTIGAGYGVSTRGTVGKLVLDYSIARVGNATLGVQGEGRLYPTSRTESGELTGTVMVHYSFGK